MQVTTLKVTRNQSFHVFFCYFDGYAFQRKTHNNQMTHSSHQKLSVLSCRKHVTSIIVCFVLRHTCHIKTCCLSCSKQITNWTAQSRTGCTATFEHKLAILNYQARLKKDVIQRILQMVLPHPCAHVLMRHTQLAKKTVAHPRISC